MKLVKYLQFSNKIAVFLRKPLRVAFSFIAIYQQIVPNCWKLSQIEQILIKIQYLNCFVSFSSYFYQIIPFFTRISRAKLLFLAFDRLILDNTWIYSLSILCVHNLLQNIFDSSPTPGFLLNWLRNFNKISIANSKPQNQEMHTLPTLRFLSMLQYSQSFEYVLIYFVSYKIGLKVLSGTFFKIGLSFLEAGI